MTFRRIQFVAVAFVLFILLLAAGVAQPAKHASASSTADWTFEGCWTRSSAGQCRDVFRDQNGDHWICRDCGTTGKPGPGKCSPISQGTLSLGFWCS